MPLFRIKRGSCSTVLKVSCEIVICVSGGTDLSGAGFELGGISFVSVNVGGVINSPVQNI